MFIILLDPNHDSDMNRITLATFTTLQEITRVIYGQSKVK